MRRYGVPEHFVVGVTGEHYLASVELVDGAACAPQVDGEVVLETENDLRRSVKSAERKFLDFIF